MRRTLVAGNWKMNGSRESIRELLDGIKKGIAEVSAADMAVCAPFVYLADVAEQLQGTGITYGSQDISKEEKGAFTGEISAAMLNDFDCRYAIVGHSERRTYHAESDELVARKCAAALDGGLVPILCVGETLEEREQGVTNDVVARQLDAAINLCGIAAFETIVIAYEPVWAIGTGKTASPEQAQEVHKFIRERLAAKDTAVAQQGLILYGGSMNPGNAKELLAQEDIDGGLIGGASLKPDDFLAIGKAAA